MSFCSIQINARHFPLVFYSTGCPHDQIAFDFNHHVSIEIALSGETMFFQCQRECILLTEIKIRLELL